jgi:hypothetical protein
MTDVIAEEQGLVAGFGPWLDDHRIVVYDTDQEGKLARHARVLDLDEPGQVSRLPELGELGVRFRAYFVTSPSHKWLAALVEAENQAGALLLTRVRPTGLDPWTKVLTFEPGTGPAMLNFSGDEGYLVVEAYSFASGLLSNRVYPVRLSEPPVGLSPYDVPVEEYLDYVMLAPTGARFFVHTTRKIDAAHGSNPITVIDAETAAKLEVTPKYYSSSSPGFTPGGMGILGYAYSYFEDHGMEWFGVPADFSSSVATPLVSGAGYETLGGEWSKGGAWFGLCGNTSSDFTKRTGPIDLERFDFAPVYQGATHLAHLSEYANVDSWSFSPDASALVYRVAVTSSVYAAASPLTQGHYATELGTYWVSTAGGKPTLLALAWTGYDTLHWLPDNQGLLRSGPEGTVDVVADAHWANGVGANYANPGATQELHWLRLNGFEGIVTNLSAYLGRGQFLSSMYDPEIPDRW